MKTTELTGAQLDYWVAKALGLKPIADDDPEYGVRIEPRVPEEFEIAGPWYDRFSPSQWWAQGGPIIERERIRLDGRDRNDRPHGEWCAQIMGPRLHFGSTPLVAAMRAYVASKFGEEVPDETA